MMSHEERRDLETNPRIMIFGASTSHGGPIGRSGRVPPPVRGLFCRRRPRRSRRRTPFGRLSKWFTRHRRQLPSTSLNIHADALENRPTLIETLASLRLLWGNPADVLYAVRNPFRLFETLKAARLPALAVRESDSPPPAEGRWLLKPWGGAAGRGIQIWQPGPLPVEQVGEPCYFQERKVGKPISALFLATRNGAVLIGVSEQLIGLPALSARPFAYCGSIGPMPLAKPTCRQIVQTGEAVACEFGLRGLFGIDLVLDQGTGVAWPTEVNPRYTASVEIYEWVFGLSLLTWHILACQAYESSSASRRLIEEFQSELGTARLERPTRQAAKVVIYAPFSLHAPDLTEVARLHGFGTQRVEIADRPGRGFRSPRTLRFAH